MYGRPRMMAVVMAGGQGSRLMPLTRDRAKPAVPFGGVYRIIDFVLSNCLHSGLRHILLATQYRSDSLSRHIEATWNVFTPGLGGFVQCSPPQQRVGERWYAGTADSVYQNLFRVRDVDPEHVIILAGDHIYKADYRRMLDVHQETRADVTVACLRVSVAEAAGRFGVAVCDERGRIVAFEEKPSAPTPLSSDPRICLASMGIYIFDTQVLLDALELGPGLERDYDFGADILPSMVRDGARVFAWRFEDENDKEQPYWRDVGTVEAYYEATMDLVRPVPTLNLYDKRWPILCNSTLFLPPAKFVFAWRDRREPRVGRAVDSIVSPGVIVSGGLVERSVLSPEVRVNSFSTVQDSILFDGVEIGRHARVRRAIVDKGVYVPEGVEIGFDGELDRQRFHVSPGGIVVVPKGYVFEDSGPLQVSLLD